MIESNLHVENYNSDIAKNKLEDSNNIDYRYLLRECMREWIVSEGCCWDADDYEYLTPEEKYVINEIRDELLKNC
jgi:hypothetical protein